METKQYTYRFRIYPNKKQEDFFQKSMGCNRFIYNFFLERAINLYDNHNIKFNFYEFRKIIPLLKKGFPFLKEVTHQSLQASLGDLKIAYERFFKKKSKFPKFKKKSDLNSIKIRCGFKYIGDRLYIPKLDDSIKVKVNRSRKNSRVLITEKVKSISISKVASGKWYVNMLVEKEFTPLEKTNRVSGIDLGIKSFASITSGTSADNYTSIKIDNPKYLLKSEDQLKKLNRQFAKKTKGSKNKLKFRKRLAREYEKVTNQRKDFLHKLSSRAVNDNQVIALEDLNIKGMVKNRHLSKSISDASWSMFGNMLAYKADWYGREVVKVDRFYPSSKICSVCGYVKRDLDLSDRNWTCPDCRTTHDRDENASTNLFLEGLKIGSVRPELTPVEYALAENQSIGSSYHTKKQEAYEFIER